MENHIYQNNFQLSNENILYNKEIKHHINDPVNKIADSNFSNSESNKNYSLNAFNDYNSENKIPNTLESKKSNNIKYL